MRRNVHQKSPLRAVDEWPHVAGLKKKLPPLPPQALRNANGGPQLACRLAPQPLGDTLVDPMQATGPGCGSRTSTARPAPHPVDHWHSPVRARTGLPDLLPLTLREHGSPPRASRVAQVHTRHPVPRQVQHGAAVHHDHRGSDSDLRREDRPRRHLAGVLSRREDRRPGDQRVRQEYAAADHGRGR